MNNIFKHSSKDYIEYEKVLYYEKEFKRQQVLNLILKPKEHLCSLLLDSSLINATQKEYNAKIIDCGNYIQVYRFTGIKLSKRKEKEFKNKKILLDNNYLFKEENLEKQNELKVVEYKNIMRSKFNLQRIVKANENEFKTFITLTFEDLTYKDIDIANRKFHIWITKIKSIYKDFKYVGVPEYQKRGVVHYHLMTNIEIEKIYDYIRRDKKVSVKLIDRQKEFTSKQLEKMSIEQRKKCYDVKYWSYGFTSVYPLYDINVIGYLTKYFTKDIDNRLFGHRKYFNSRNLKIPKEVLINEKEQIDRDKLFFIENLYNPVFTSTYYDKLGNEIEFVEYKKS